MKVLTINPPNKPFNEPALLIEPIDLLSVATWIREQGQEVEVVDMDRAQLQPAGLVERFCQRAPDVVVIPFDYHVPLFSPDASSYVKEIVSLAEKHGVRVILGGRPASSRPEEYLSSSSVVIVVGEMEHALAALLSTPQWIASDLAAIRGIVFKDGGGHIIRTPLPCKPVDLDVLPVPDRSLVALDSYIDVRTMLTSRGCGGRCVFCPVSSFWGDWRGRRACSVVDEIEILVRQYNAKKILFLDDNAAVDSVRMRQISSEILRRGIQVALGCLASISSFDAETFRLMHRAGFRWLHFGAESGNDKILKKLNKGIRVEAIRQVVCQAREMGFRVRTSWIMDPPGNSARALDDTIKLILDTNADEVRLHFFAMRDCAPVSSGREYSVDSEVSRYLHASSPGTSSGSVSREELLLKVADLENRLGERGYAVIRDPAEWAKIGKLALQAKETKFVSFCPGRYGIGW